MMLLKKHHDVNCFEGRFGTASASLPIPRSDRGNANISLAPDPSDHSGFLVPRLFRIRLCWCPLQLPRAGPLYVASVRLRSNRTRRPARRPLRLALRARALPLFSAAAHESKQNKRRCHPGSGDFHHTEMHRMPHLAPLHNNELIRGRFPPIAGRRACRRYHALSADTDLRYAQHHSFLLPAMFSLKPCTNHEIAALIRSIVIQEMLCMTISANILITIAGRPQINKNAGAGGMER
jgi:hypothetical protein